MYIITILFGLIFEKKRQLLVCFSKNVKTIKLPANEKLH